MFSAFPLSVPNLKLFWAFAQLENKFSVNEIASLTAPETCWSGTEEPVVSGTGIAGLGLVGLGLGWDRCRDNTSQWKRIWENLSEIIFGVIFWGGKC